MPVAVCPHCGNEQELSEFMLSVGEAFGLVGVLCDECPERIPAENIENEA